MAMYRTDDMALAAYLRIEAQENVKLEWEMSSCFFCFSKSEKLFSLISEFERGMATVEPRQYSMTFAMLKKAMFAHPDAPSAWKRGRGRRSATG